MTERQRDAQSRHSRWCNCDSCTGANEEPRTEACDECRGKGSHDEVHAGQYVRVGCQSCRGSGEQPVASPMPAENPFKYRLVDPADVIALLREVASDEGVLAADYIEWLEAENKRLDRLINNPHTDDFLEAVRIEAAHQRERWPEENDQRKTPEDWFWLIGYLVGKAIRPDDPGKRLHHIITTAAACLNWHRHEAP